MIGHVVLDVLDGVLVDLWLLRRGHVGVGGAALCDEGFDGGDQRALYVEHALTRLDDQASQAHPGVEATSI